MENRLRKNHLHEAKSRPLIQMTPGLQRFQVDHLQAQGSALDASQVDSAPSLFPSSEPIPRRPALFSTTTNNVQPRVIRVEISYVTGWKPGEITIIQNQEARCVKRIRGLIFELPLQKCYSFGTEVGTLLPDGRIDMRNGQRVITGSRVIKIWIDGNPPSDR